MTISLSSRATLPVSNMGSDDIIVRASAESQGDLRSAGSGVSFRAEIEISEPTAERPEKEEEPRQEDVAPVIFAAADAESLVPTDATPQEIGNDVQFRVADTIYFGLRTGSTLVVVRNTLSGTLQAILPSEQVDQFLECIKERLRGKGLTEGSGDAEKLRDPGESGFERFLAGMFDVVQDAFDALAAAFRTRVAAGSLALTNVTFRAVTANLLPASIKASDLFALVTPERPTDGELVVALQPFGAGTETTARISLPADRRGLDLDLERILGGLADTTGPANGIATRRPRGSVTPELSG